MGGVLGDTRLAKRTTINGKGWLGICAIFRFCFYHDETSLVVSACIAPNMQCAIIKNSFVDEQHHQNSLTLRPASKPSFLVVLVVLRHPVTTSK